MTLFVDRAQAADSSFALSAENAAAIAGIVRRLDGLPLAIELAAARARTLPPAALLSRLEQQSLRLLSGGPRDQPDRQRTMRDAIAWSYALLSPADQRLFRTLAVFVGGFSLEAAAAVAGDGGDQDLDVLDGVAALIDKGLVRRREGFEDEPRFTMLETIREFGLERLAASGEEPETRRRHAAFFLQLVEQLDAFWAPYRPDAQEILDRLEAEFPNLRATLGWLRETGDVAHLLQLAGALSYVWQLRGHIREGREWLEWGLGQASNVPPRARAAGQVALAGILYHQVEFARVLELCDAAIAAFAAAGDAMGVVDACGKRDPGRLQLRAAGPRGRLSRARPHHAGDGWGPAVVGASRQRPRAPPWRHRADGWPVR